MAKILNFETITRKKRESLIHEMMPSIKILAKKINLQYPSILEVDDLISAGVIGLMQSFETFESDKNVKFKTYAEHRIRGSMLDEIRKCDWASRYYRDQIKELKKLSKKMINERGEIDNVQLQRHLKLSDYKYYELLKKVEKTEKVINFEELIYAQDETESQLNRLMVIDNIDRLNENEQKVIHSYYFDQKSMKEIANELSLSESRISQIHKKAISLIREDIDLAA
ncbi:MAG: RNA polymerase sigma factor WhiG [Bdellovibrio sp.]